MGRVIPLPVQFGMPNMSADFLGPSTENKEQANLIKLRIKNWLPPPDQGRFQDNFEKNARAMIARINELIHRADVEKAPMVCEL